MSLMRILRESYMRQCLIRAKHDDTAICSHICASEVLSAIKCKFKSPGANIKLKKLYRAEK